MAKRRTILLTCTSEAWGGQEIHAFRLCCELDKRGYRVVMACHPLGKIIGEARSAGFPVVEITYRWPPFWPEVRRLIRTINSQSIDLVHCHFSKDLWKAVPAGRLAGVPVLLTKHSGSYVSKKNPQHAWLYHRVKKVVAVSDIINKNLLDTCPLDASQVVTIYPGVDVDLFKPNEGERMAVRREFEIPSDTIVAGIVSRLEPSKGHVEFLQAASMALREFPDMVFLICGQGSYPHHRYHEDLKSLAQELGIEQRVIFTGFREDNWRIFAALDIFVFPSKAEAFGLALVEAMATGLPCISGNTDAPLEIVEHGRTGLFVRADDSELIARYILDLAKDQGFRDRLGRAAREEAVSRFSWHSTVDRLEELYQEVLQ